MSNYKIIGGDQKEYGPVSADELHEWIAEGRLNEKSLAQAEGTSAWRPLGTFPEFANAFGSASVPPAAFAATSQSSAETTVEILSRTPELRLGECLRGGFSFLTGNAGFVLGAVCITLVLCTVMKMIPLLGGILSWLLSGVLLGGFYFACIRRLRGEAVSAGNVFDGFKLCFVQLMLVGAMSKLLIQLGLALCILPGIYLLVAWQFALPLVMDKKLEFWSAMELSRKVVTRVWFPVAILLLLTFLPLLLFQAYCSVRVITMIFEILQQADFDILRAASELQTRLPEIMALSFKILVGGQLVLLLNYFYAAGVLTHAYENLFGTRKA